MTEPMIDLPGLIAKSDDTDFLKDRDCQDFRVRAGIMGKKEAHYVPTQGAGDPG